jgi:hypothetical protein
MRLAPAIWLHGFVALTSVSTPTPGDPFQQTRRTLARVREQIFSSVNDFTSSRHQSVTMFDQSAERKAPQGQLKHTGKDDGSDAQCRAGRFARPHGRDPAVRPKPNDNARRPSLSLLPPHDRGQRGRATGLLRRLAHFPQGLATGGAAIASSFWPYLRYECRMSVAVAENPHGAPPRSPVMLRVEYGEDDAGVCE